MGKRTPKRPQECAVAGCSNPPPYVFDWCKKHYQRWKKYGDPELTLRRERRNDSYLAVHARVKKAHGKASQHSCVRCGEQAAHWACVRNAVAHDVVGSAGRRTPVKYSMDVDDYSPLCEQCHGQEDHSVLTEDDVREIRALRAEGVLLREIGKRYGISRVQVGRIVRNLSWRNVY